MPVADIDNGGRRLQIAYAQEGEGECVLLIHGFASNKEVNWINTGWTRALVEAGMRAVAIDNRGHGESTKFHDRAAYTLAQLADDAALFLDAIGVATASVVGYSMGARISAMLAVRHPGRVSRLVLSGYGDRMVQGPGDWTNVHDALLAPSIEHAHDRRARAFRAFAEQTGSDRQALAACIAGMAGPIPREDLARVTVPVLVAVGTEDDVAGSGERLAEIFPHGRFFAIEGRDHMRAVGDRSHVREAVAFLKG
jgi:pimeloyl-ACP methyl ester carboxylesterase